MKTFRHKQLENSCFYKIRFYILFKNPWIYKAEIFIFIDVNFPTLTDKKVQNIFFKEGLKT